MRKAKKIALVTAGLVLVNLPASSAFANSPGYDAYCSGPAYTFSQWFAQRFLCH